MLTTTRKGNIRFSPALLFVIASAILLVFEGLTGNFRGDATLDIHLHDSYFVIVHSHMVMGVAAFFGLCAAIYHWFPRIFGRYMNSILAYIHTWVTILVTLLIFWRMHYEGLAGMPRRYVDDQNWYLFNQFNDLNNFVLATVNIVFAVQALFLVNLLYSIFRGAKSTTRQA